MFQIGESLLCLERMFDLFVYAKDVECLGAENTNDGAEDILLFKVDVHQITCLILDVIDGFLNVAGLQSGREENGPVEPADMRRYGHGGGILRSVDS